MPELNTIDQVRYAIQNAVTAPGKIVVMRARTPFGLIVTKEDPVSGAVVHIGFFRLAEIDYQNLLKQYPQGG